MNAITKKRYVGQRADESLLLLREAQNGSQAAFRQIVLNEQKNVRMFLARYLLGSEQVDDLAQEVFIAAYKKLGDFRHEAKFSTWLLGIARNKALQYLRTESRRKKHLNNYMAENQIEAQIQCLESQSIRENEDEIVALKDCVKKLPHHAKNIVDKFYFKQLATADIAAKEGKNSGAIRMKLFRIRKKLASCISTKMNKSR